MIENALGSFIYEGRGEVNHPFGKSISIVFKISHLKYAAEQFSTEIKVIDSTYNVDELCSLTGQVMELKIIGTVPEDYDVRIFNIRTCQVSQDTLTLIHQAYDLGMTSNYSLERTVISSCGLEKLILMITLTNSPFLKNLIFRTLYDNGTISIKYLGKNCPELNMEIELGKTTISPCYTYEDIKVDGHDSTVQIEQFRIIVLVEPKLHNIPQLFDRVESQLEDIILLMSLFSRCFIRCTQIQLCVLVPRGFTYPSPTRQYVKNTRISYSRNMFNLKQFDDKELQSILEQYRKEENYETLKNVILFLLSSYEDGVLETSYFLVHSGLEAICKHQTKHIERCKMKDYERVIYTIKELKIEPQIIGLWIGTEHDKGMNIDFESGIKQAFSVRNELFHEAKVKEDLYFNLKTFRHILEIIVLTLLGITKTPVEAF
ncbi:MAG: hypothetical protein PHP00_08055 [Thiotrichaceae bacterium]|nr:hypothetical protein [Thiotrichaceae bacterium]